MISNSIQDIVADLLIAPSNFGYLIVFLLVFYEFAHVDPVNNISPLIDD